MTRFLNRMGNYARAAWRLPSTLRWALQNISATQAEILRLNDLQYRDLLDLTTGACRIKHNATVSLITNHPVAHDSPDHLSPFGTIQDNTRNPAFTAKCRQLYGPELRFLDLGCSGGGLVFDFALRGHLAIGLEGSDRSRKAERANWRTIPANLFTCDITKPFTLQAAGQPQLFDIISCWEVLEHIPLADLPMLLDNVKRHLAPNGIFVGSISKSAEDPLHVTQLENDGWQKAFATHGLTMSTGYSDVFEFSEFCRGIKSGVFDNHDYRAEPRKGLHFIARKAAD